jgi:hypothetical protein
MAVDDYIGWPNLKRLAGKRFGHAAGRAGLPSRGRKRSLVLYCLDRPMSTLTSAV